MKKLFLIVAILCSVGILGAQEIPAASDATAVIPGLETAAGFVIGGGIANGVSIAVYSVASHQTGGGIEGGNAAWVAMVSALPLIPIGYLTSTIAYSNFLETYNSAYPSDRQNMLPFLFLTLGGTAAILPYLVWGSGHSDIPLPLTVLRGANLTLTSGIAIIGLISHVIGMVVAVDHTQELLAKAKASGTAPAVSELSTQQDRITIMPDIGANYLGVAITMP